MGKNKDFSEEYPPMVEHRSTTDSADVNPIKGLWIKFQVKQISTSEVSLLD